MKEFEMPQYEVVYFTKSDIITSSDCEDCDGCTEGKKNCGSHWPSTSD